MPDALHRWFLLQCSVPRNPEFPRLHGAREVQNKAGGYKFAADFAPTGSDARPARNRIGFTAMESPARQISLVPPPDRRQSETALAIARGTARLLRSLGFSCISELPLPSGRRADLVALNEQAARSGSSRSSRRWRICAPTRNGRITALHCDRLFFAFTQDLPCEIFPARYRPDHRRRLWRASALRGAGASPAGADAQGDDGAVRDGRGAADQPAGRSAGA